MEGSAGDDGDDDGDDGWMVWVCVYIPFGLTFEELWKTLFGIRYWVWSRCCVLMVGSVVVIGWLARACALI